jgi:hypothetical protein
MRHSWGLVVLGALALAVAGCGGGSTYVPGGADDDRGVVVEGTMESIRSFDGPPPLPPLGGRDDEGPGELNPNYPNKFIVPSQYSVAVAKVELLRGTDDPDPFVIIDTCGVADPAVVDLVAGTGVEVGRTESYPEPGTYTHIRLTLVYLEMEIPADIGDGSGCVEHIFRLYTSSVGEVLNGDVLVLCGGEWCWISEGDRVPVSEGRPDAVSGWEWTEFGPEPLSSVVQDMHFSQGDEESPDPAVFTQALAEPLVIPDSPDSLYVVTLNFDITETPMYEDGDGTFVFDDVPNATNLAGDGLFKPGVGWNETGDSGDGEGAPQGRAFWSPLSPLITARATND